VNRKHYMLCMTTGITKEPQMSAWNEYIHPDDVVAANRAMQDHLTGKTTDYSIEQRIQNSQGQWVWMLSRGMVINRNGDGVATRMVGTHTDISAHKASEQLIWEQANVDALTHLPNRRQFNKHLESAIQQGKDLGSSFILMFIDLDNFKIINDTHGHKAGDLLLREAADRLTNCVRKKDIVSRLGGDEFTIILNTIDDSKTTENIAKSVLKALARPFLIDFEAFHITASIGITRYPEDASTHEILLMNADQAMYEAKALGRNRYQYFSLEMRISAQTRMRTINELREAVKAEQFEVYYQPIVCFKTGKIIKAECLIRWQHPTQGLLGADSIIRLAEETNMIVDIGNWIFYRATEQLIQWRRKYHTDFKISVNTSPAQYVDDGCVVEDWLAHMDKLGLPFNSLIVEITEGLLLNLDENVTSKLKKLRDSGIGIALDDFGTGYSSLSYLQEIHSDFLKIDRSFVNNIMYDEKTKALCNEIIKIAHIYNTQVIAEGIETIEQSRILRDNGCDFGQGYLYSKPVSATEFETLLKQQLPKRSREQITLASNDNSQRP
ncbi:MAG: putative bifunctional diguanylate cyclase/phosphodiesterase, partial [Leucothrix sp.]